MTEKRRQQVLRQLKTLEESYSGPVELRYRDGRQRIVYIECVRRDTEVPSLQFATEPPSLDVYGSKVDPRDWLPTVPLHDLGYVKAIEKGQKISLMPFRE